MSGDVERPRGPSERDPLLRQDPGSRGLDARQDEAMKSVEDHYNITPDSSVYSYFLHMPPIEHHRLGTHWNWVTVFAIFLVVLNFVMQISLLTIIGACVLEEHGNQVHSILQQGQPHWYNLHSFLGPKQESSNCRHSRSLCHPTPGGGVTCAPPSLSLLGSWDLLDTDGDGVWSRQEAEDPAYRALTRCDFNMDSLLIYEEMLLNLRQHGALEGRLVPMIKKGSGIPRPYFDWYIGEPLMCVYGDADMCGNMFHMGVFDQVLLGRHRNSSSAPRGITDFPSAFDYCLDLLNNRCQKILPYSYRGWVTLSNEKCGKKTFEATVYKSPTGEPTQSILKVDFDLRQSYENTRTASFLVFLSVLLIVFFCTMLEEWKQIYRVALFIMQYGELEHKLVGTELDEDQDIAGAALHRTALGCVTLLRFLLWLFLLYTGTIFLSSGTEYLGLIFDALSLVFIIQIDEALYSALLRAPMKTDHQEAPTFEIRRRRLPVSVFVAEFALVTGLVLAACVVTYFYRVDTLRPLQEALDCVCLVEGEKCEEAVTYSPAFWQNYWGSVLPASSAQIDRLMAPATVVVHRKHPW